MYVSRLFHLEKTFCAIPMQELHILVSVLDLDNAIVGLDDHRTPTRARPITPIISLNDVKDAPSASCVQQDEKEPNGAF